MHGAKALFSVGICLWMTVGVAEAASAFAPEVVERGRHLAVAADCAACHTATGGAAYAGGYALQSPLGTIYSSNITPSRKFGIGEYSEPQFARTLRQGVRADGAHLYPAMPYASYTALTDTDVQALYAYFMQAVAPVEHAPPATALPFPFGLRFSMAAWNALFLDDHRFVEQPKRSAVWNRGAYLVEALEHCGACHTPRGFLMQSQSDRALRGAPLGDWYAPNITSDSAQGIGAWKPEEIVTYLKTGRLDGKARAAGGMAEAVTHSLSRLSDADLQAIATYLLTVPGGSSQSDSSSSFTRGEPVDREASMRGATDLATGGSLYSGLCASCHQANGAGTRDQVVPSLFHNSTVGADRKENLIAVILHGVDRDAGGHHVLMPGFDETSFVQPLSDMQVAAVASYVRATYGGRPADITAADVAVSRQGGLRSTLPLLACLVMVLVVLLLLAALAAWRWTRRQTPET